jgi:ribosomal protein S18 acetylase RimI-like enzyme
MEQRIELEDPRDFLVWRMGSGNTVEIFDIQVGSERRSGRGRALVNLLLNKFLPRGVKRVWAITRDTNFIAHQFYEELKFRGVPLRDFYGQGGVDAIMFIRDLESKA